MVKIAATIKMVNLRGPPSMVDTYAFYACCLWLMIASWLPARPVKFYGAVTCYAHRCITKLDAHTYVYVLIMLCNYSVSVPLQLFPILKSSESFISSFKTVIKLRLMLDIMQLLKYQLVFRNKDFSIKTRNALLFLSFLYTDIRPIH